MNQVYYEVYVSSESKFKNFEFKGIDYIYHQSTFNECVIHSKNNRNIRDTLEKVYRLVDILEYINQNSLLKNTLALKGGTAINLLVFNLPRLSIDIDLDYCK